MSLTSSSSAVGDGAADRFRGAPPPPAGEVTRWLVAWSEGDDDARERLIPLVYDELRRMAAQHLRGERHDHTLQPTTLVHELYLRLARLPRVEWHQRAQFFALAAKLMRRILVDHARHRGYEKRGGGRSALTLDEIPEPPAPEERRFLALEEALGELGRLDELKAGIVELRFFVGLSVEETAAVLGRSRPTVLRHWRVAKAWLHARLDDADGAA